jgi:hypothetical protein
MPDIDKLGTQADTDRQSSATDEKIRTIIVIVLSSQEEAFQLEFFSGRCST